MQLNIKDNTIQLLPERAMFWVDRRMLILADVHLGKSAHFQKAGIPLASAVSLNDIAKLERCINKYKPEVVCFLGDLFHSTYNKEWELFSSRIAKYPAITFYLVQGNHDVLHPEKYEAANILLKQQWLVQGLLLSHIPLNNIPESTVNICGHIHPGIKLKGKARQKARLPCFYNKPKQWILPAFSDYVGQFIIKPKPNEKVYLPLDDEVLAI